MLPICSKNESATILAARLLEMLCIMHLKVRFVTADERQRWTNYVNNENEYLIIGAVVHSEYSNIRYLHLIYLSKHFFGVMKKVSKSKITFPLQVGICYILPHNQIIKRNNQSE